MAERAAHLVDHVIPAVPVRQWVLSVFNAVAAHHGMFTGTSDEGVGTTFRLTLPLFTP